MASIEESNKSGNRKPLQERLQENRERVKERAAEKPKKAPPREDKKRPPIQRFKDAVLAQDLAKIKNMDNKNGAIDKYGHGLFAEYSTRKVGESEQVEVLKFLIEKCDLKVMQETRHTIILDLTRAKRFKAIKVLLDSGSDLNDLNLSPSATKKKTLAAIIMDKHAQESSIVNFLVTHGADISEYTQSSLKKALLRRDLGTAHRLLKQGARLNAQDGEFAKEILGGLYQQRASNKIIEDDLNDTIQFMMLNGMTVKTDSFIRDQLRSSDNLSPELEDYFYSKINEKLTANPRPMPDFSKITSQNDLRDAFNAINKSDNGKMTAADLLMAQDKDGYSLLDYLCVQGQLWEAFDPIFWSGREGKAINVLKNCLPKYRDKNLEAALKTQITLQQKSQRKKPVLKR